MCGAQRASRSAATTTDPGGSSHDQLRRWRIATAAAILTMLAGSVAVRGGVPSRPNPAPHRSIASPDSPRRCPLRRIDRQLVRCDNLTGAGVAAPLSIPEL